jgi:RND family efflux transporter MFP subunit
MSAKTSRLALNLTLVAAVLAAGTIWALRSLRQVAIVEPVISSEAIDAKPGTVTVDEQFAMELKSEQGGRVLADGYALREGDQVKPGQVLLQLDPTDIKLALERDQAIYDTTNEHYKADHSNELKLESDEAALESHRRENQLGAFPTADLQAEERAVESQRQSVAILKIDERKILSEMEYTLKTERLQLERMTVRSPPFDMVVKTVNVHPGDLIGAQASIATLITQEKRVVGKISDEDFADIKVGQAASVFFVPYNDYLFKGRVSQILPTTDPLTQRHLIYLDVDIPDEKLVPGINGEVSVTVDQHLAKAVVPRRAVFSVDGDAVYVVKDGRVELRKVTKGFVWTTGIEITQGLEPGERVIVESLEDFHAGQTVAVEEHPSDAVTPNK